MRSFFVEAGKSLMTDVGFAMEIHAARVVLSQQCNLCVVNPTTGDLVKVVDVQAGSAGGLQGFMVLCQKVDVS